jgi:RHS repeat-associated protein
MKYFKPIVLSVAVAFAVGSAMADGGDPTAVTAIPGKFSVSSAGAAEYDVPIAVPPGTNGLVPTLSLSYSSQNSDGTVGIGWALTGLMTITRCPRTIAQDGTHGSVNFNSDDRFCLNGQRLIVINGGTYGAAGSEYRTEVDQYSRIIANGSVGGGPASFTVYTKSGLIIELGNTSDSQALAVLPGTPPVRVWAENKASDTVGNYLTVTYNSASGTDRTVNGEIYPLRIDYTGNANAGTSPYNSVQLTYTARSDAPPTYQAGAFLKATHLLTNIKTYQGSSVVFDYQLGYRAGTLLVRSRLISVTQCDGATPTPHCLRPTTFGWQGGGDRLSVTSAPNPYSNGVQLVLPADYNADGLADFATINPSAGQCPPYPVFLGTPSGFVTSSYTLTNGASAYSTPNCGLSNPPPMTIVDPTGTAMVSLQVTGFSGPPTYASQQFLSLLTTSGPIDLASMLGVSSVVAPQSGDFDGDGIPDFLQQGSPLSDFYIANRSGGGYTKYAGYSGYDWIYTGVLLADFDGDGCTDALQQEIAPGGTNAVTYSPFCHPAVASTGLPSGNGNFYYAFGDFNGDGKTDVIASGNGISLGDLGLYLSTGIDFVNYTDPLAVTNYDNPFYVGDFNGDGKADLIDANGKIWLSTGSDFVQASDPSGNPVVIPMVGTPIIADWNSDGASDILMRTYSGTGTNDTLYTFAYTPELMTSVDNGVGATTAVTYDRLNKGSPFYSKGSAATYPSQNVFGSVYVVSSVSRSNGLGACPGNCYVQNYSYTGAQTNLQGRGFLGFSQVVIADPQTNITQTTNYSLTFPYIGLITSQTKVHSVSGSNVTLDSITNTLSQNASCGVTPASGVYQVCITQTVETRNDLKNNNTGAALPTVTTTSTYDGWGNALTNNVSTTDGTTTYTKNTTNQYAAPDTTAPHWYIGQLTCIKVDATVGASHVIRTSGFEYDAATGLLTKETIEPYVTGCQSNSGSAAYSLVTAYGHDQFGNRTTATVTGGSGGSAIPQRTTIAAYDSLGQFKIRTVNAAGDVDLWAYDPRFGVPVTHTDPNMLATTWTYDYFGRRTQELRPDGTMTNSTYVFCSGGCLTNASFYVQNEDFAPNGSTQIGAITISYFDSLSRVIAKDSQGFDGKTSRVAIVYDANLFVVQTSRPYFVTSDTPQWTAYSNDDLGRPKIITFPNGAHTNMDYNGVQSTVTNNLSQSTVTTLNIWGQKATVRDAASNTTTYTYDAFNNVLTVIDPAGNVITNTYDIRGNKLSSADPDLGSWSYTYDALQDLLTQTDAKSQVTTLTYDLLGRPLTRSEANFYSEWTYGSSPGARNVGRVVEEKSCTSSPSGCTSVISDRTFTFDGAGRPDSNTLSVGGEYFGYHQSYSATNGKLSKVTYPSGFAATYSYNSYGYLAALADGGGAPIWTGNARDAEGHLTSQTQGNGVLTTQGFDPQTGLLQNQRAGALVTAPNYSVASFDYTYDTIGNLLSRADNTPTTGFTETFCYTDSLNRLTNSKVGASCLSGKTFAYNSIGNITSKSDAGTYTYPSAGSARPHAVSSIIGTVDGVTNPNYQYDANGNLTCVYTGASCPSSPPRKFTVTSFNMAATVAQTVGSTITTLTFAYDAGHQRVSQAMTVTGVANTTTTVYANDTSTGAQSQRVKVGTGVPQWVDYVQIDGQIIAQRTVTYQSGSLWGFSTWNSFNWGPPAGGSSWGSFNWGSGTWTGPLVTWAYFTLDNLGSVAVISGQGGAVAQRLSYDPWGKQRNFDGTDASCGSVSSSTTRGFTNQEQMATQCLVNLNARVYDPSIGRFMSADSVVPDPFYGQSYNRFSYVNNSPLIGVDPSGHECIGCVTGIETVTVTGEKDPNPHGVIGLGGGFASNGVTGDYEPQLPPGNSPYQVPFNNLRPTLLTRERDRANWPGGTNAPSPAALMAMIKAGLYGEFAGLALAAASTNSARYTNGDVGIPAKLEVLYSLTEDHGNFSVYYYQIEDKYGRPLKGPGYSVKENVITMSPNTPDSKNSNTKYVPVPDGRIPDVVGWARQDQAGNFVAIAPPTNADWNYFQTFNVKYNGQTYQLSTELWHNNFSQGGVVMNHVIPLN